MFDELINLSIHAKVMLGLGALAGLLAIALPFVSRWEMRQQWRKMGLGVPVEAHRRLELPGSITDICEHATYDDFPAFGELGKFYVAIDTGLLWRWDGSTYCMLATPGPIPDDDIGDAPISETKFIITVDYHDGSKVYYFRTRTSAEKVYNVIHDEELPLEKNEGIVKITFCEVISTTYRDTGDVIEHKPTE